ncbi:DUF4087 domain-containing protein [Microcoleus sp. MON1_C1]
MLISVIISSLFIVALPAKAVESRCGWLLVPTPGNRYLIDKDGTWTIGAQGGYQAKGIENIPHSDGKEVVRTNGNYGYTCACLNVTVNTNSRRISEIRGGESLPLSTCREDPNLPKSP